MTRLRHFPRVDVVCFGSSRFGGGIDEATVMAGLRHVSPVQTPVIFNASVPLGDFVASEFMLHQLRQAGVRPTYALVEINPGFVNRRNDWMTAHIRRQLNWSDLPTYFGDIWKAQRLGPLLSTRLNPIHCYRDELCQQAKAWATASATSASDREKSDPAARAADGVPWTQVLAALPPPSRGTPAGLAMDTKAIYNILRSFRIGGTSTAACERFLQACRDADIRVILVEAPLTCRFRERIPPAIDIPYRAYVNELTRRYACRFVDYRDQVPDEMFLDIHHLNPAGARYFSQRLSTEVLAPLWQRPSSR
jgi:hypothetical protein